MSTLQAPAAAAVCEYPVAFRTTDHDLFGILTKPLERSVPGVVVVLLTGGAYVAATNRNRLSVNVARRLAREGLHVFRFDYHGVGESGGSIQGYTLHRPFVGDLAAAVGWLEDQGFHTFLLIGSCFGARTIMSAAESIKGLAGVMLISTPVVDADMGDPQPLRYAAEMSVWQLARRAARVQTIRNLLAAPTRESYLWTRHLYQRTLLLKGRMIGDRLLGRSRNQEKVPPISEAFVRQFHLLAERQISMLFLYGREDSFYCDFERACQSPLRTAWTNRRGHMALEILEGEVHGFTSVRAQHAVSDRALSWIRSILVSP